MLMVRTPPWLSRVFSSPSLLHSRVGWGLPLSTLRRTNMIRRRMLFLVVNGDVEQAALNPEEYQDAKDKDGDNVISTNPSVWFL